MTRVTSDLLNDTFHLIQLARETAKLQGYQAKADQLAPLVEDLRNLVTQASEPRAAVPASGLMTQRDYQTLLAAVQPNPQSAASQGSQWTPPSSTDRNQVIHAMSNGGMTELDIARQMGMTRDEVHLILSLSRR